MNNMKKIRYPIVVEGRYDKSAILGMYSATVITTNGFGIFNSKEKQALIRRLAKDGLILLTDSDGGGKQIRSFITGIVPKEKIYQLYIPKIEGKEKRKRTASAEGTVGVEGVGGEVLRKILDPFCTDAEECCRREISAAELFVLGLSGGSGSGARRDAVCGEVGLPGGMSTKAFLAAINILLSYEELEELSKNILR